MPTVSRHSASAGRALWCSQTWDKRGRHCSRFSRTWSEIHQIRAGGQARQAHRKALSCNCGTERIYAHKRRIDFFLGILLTTCPILVLQELSSLIHQ
ncbi:hypothetical protein EXIGLDRAFT_272308 [Exidia glandulosa HHB12029]|uniref:Uncharacterized protein n=1 Tax=Exidia glandulosa HHB12029 TaxID=1314781 RepID=A0A165DM03_EXIGL|nr:hypothetical protein EXIGLDRAFT_272308 [Exidia glandulosa HHB12029]